MTILIPVDSKSKDECLISSIEENKAWAFVTLEEGRVLSVEFFDRREDINSWIDAVVVINELEYVWPFMDEGIIALIAPTQKSIDEIVEAFLFKDLHDFSI
jgi:predicted Fe-Mo cluster-binding NifX family protein